MKATLSGIASSDVAVGSITGLIALALVLLFLWSIYMRGGIGHLTAAATAIQKLLRKR
jgi:hypothetical protein